MKIQALPRLAPAGRPCTATTRAEQTLGLDVFQAGSLPEPDLIKPMYPLIGGAIAEEQLPGLLQSLPGWELKRVDGFPRLERKIEFPDFQSAMSFSNQVAEFAELQGHHPTLLTEWGKVTVGWWTHDVGGVHANDFTSARRTDALLRP